VAIHLFTTNPQITRLMRKVLRCVGVLDAVKTLRNWTSPAPTTSRKRSDLTVETNFVRLFLGTELPDVNKIIWLDSDVIVKDDITKMWHSSLRADSEYTVAAKWTAGRLPTVKLRTTFKERYNITPPETCLSAGVMMLNLRHMRARDHQLEKEMIWWMHKNADVVLWHLGSQPLAVLLASIPPPHDFEKLPDEWHSVGWGFQLPPEPKKEMAKASLLHYNGRNKPWIVNDTDVGAIPYLPYKEKIESCCSVDECPHVQPPKDNLNAEPLFKDKVGNVSKLSPHKSRSPPRDSSPPSSAASSSSSKKKKPGGAKKRRRNGTGLKKQNRG